MTLVCFVYCLDCTKASNNSHIDEDADISVYDVLDKDKDNGADSTDNTNEEPVDETQNVKEQSGNDPEDDDVETKATEEVQRSKNEQNDREIPGPLDVEEEKNATEENEDVGQSTDNQMLKKKDDHQEVLDHNQTSNNANSKRIT